MKPFAFKSVRAKLTFWLLLLGMVPLLGTLFMTYNQQVRSIKEETITKLEAIRDLKVQRLKGWLLHRKGDLTTISSDPQLVALEDVIDKEHKSKSDLKIYRDISLLLNRYISNYGSSD